MMSNPITIKQDYQIYEGLLDPAEWVEGAIYIAVYKNGNQFTRSVNGVKITGPNGNSWTFEQMRGTALDTRYTIGPIHTEEMIPEPPEMVNRWQCWDKDSNRWLNGFVSEKHAATPFYCSQLDVYFDLKSAMWEHSELYCDRIDELPQEYQDMFNKAKQNS